MLDNILIRIFFAAITAFAVALIMSPIIKKIAPAIGAVDIPKDNRRMHNKPMPLCGGLAIFFGFSISAFIFFDLNFKFWGIWLGALIIIIIGVLDDRFTLNAYVKLAGQFVSSIIPIIFGISIEQINIFGCQINLGFLAIPVTIIWIVSLTNAFNLIDGLDGLSCGVSAISAASIFALGIILNNKEIMLISAVLFSACVGFLPFNFNPAKIFMGDTGAMFLGYMLSVISVFGFYKTPSVISVAIPFIICGFPIFDTTFAFARRILAGKSPFYADKSHSHHKLIDRGLNQKQAVLFLYTVSILLGIFAIFISIVPPIVRIILTIAAVLTSAILLTILKNKKTKSQSK